MQTINPPKIEKKNPNKSNQEHSKSKLQPHDKTKKTEGNERWLNVKPGHRLDTDPPFPF